jgi:putative addiction module killer protein
VYQVQKTEVFDSWLATLADQKAVAKIVSRIERLEMGNPGDVEPVGDGISEMKIDYGPGYRVYHKRNGKTVVLLLCGGDKSTQRKDIKRAKELAAHSEKGTDRW